MTASVGHFDHKTLPGEGGNAVSREEMLQYMVIERTNTLGLTWIRSSRCA